MNELVYRAEFTVCAGRRRPAPASRYRCTSTVARQSASIQVVISGTFNAADDDEVPFDEAFIFFELNNTDGDLGIHAKIDGDAWKRLKIERDDNDRKLLAAMADGKRHRPRSRR